MTIDDHNSIYVGGIPYDSSENSLRRVFDPYGDIVAVKIVNDLKTRGKCYAFVTFRNPRSAANAIDDMDGQCIGGRVVRVNEVKSRFERSGNERDVSLLQRGMGRERGYDYDRERFRDVSGDRSRDRERSVGGYCAGGERGYSHNDVELEDGDRVRGRNRERSWESDRVLDSERNNGQRFVEKDQKPWKRNEGIVTSNGRSRELLTNSNDDYDDRVSSQSGSRLEFEDQLQRSTQRLEELKKEILQMEERYDESGNHVSELQQKSMKLEELLINAKKTSSRRKTQLTKLYKCVTQVRDYTEMVKRSEKELQSLIDGVLSEDIKANAALRVGIEANGNA